MSIISLIFSILGAILFGNLKGRQAEKNKIKQKENENEIQNLQQIVEVEKIVKNTSDVDRIKFMLDRTQTQKDK